MALSFLLEKGIAATLGDNNTRLLGLMEELDASPDAAEHIRQTVEAVPALLRAADEALAKPGVPVESRYLWLTVVSYMLHDRDLLPTEDSNPIMGLLDDT